MPIAEVKRLAQNADDFTVGSISSTYKVSRPVVLTRMLELGLVSREHYDAKMLEWKTDYEAKGGKADDEGGGNYYLTQASYFGDRFLKLAFGKYYEGAISRDQLADYLNVRVRNLEGFEHAVLDAPHD